MRSLNSLRTLVKHQTLRQHCSNWTGQLVQSHPSIPMRCTSYAVRNDCSLKGIISTQYFHTPFRAGIQHQTLSVFLWNKLYLLLAPKKKCWLLPVLLRNKYHKHSIHSATYIQSKSVQKERINHGFSGSKTTVLLLQAPKQKNNQQTTTKHTHTRGQRPRQTKHRQSQHENQERLFPLIRLFLKKIRVIETDSANF